jgi:hypothetical protein
MDIGNQGRSHMEAHGSVDPDDFFKINNKLLFIMKSTPTDFSAGFAPAGNPSKSLSIKNGPKPFVYEQ